MAAHLEHKQCWGHVLSVNRFDAAVHKDQVWTMDKHQEEEHDPLAALPAVPAKTTFEAADEQPYNADSRLPSVESKKVSALSNASERERLQSSMKAASMLLQLYCCVLSQRVCDAVRVYLVFMTGH